MRKKLIAILGILLLTFFVNIGVSGEVNLVPFSLSNGTRIYTDRARKKQAMIPTEYNMKDREFRGVWISQLVGDVETINSKETYMNKMVSVLDTLQEYNINSIIYHIRIMNDALYDSDLNPISSYVNNIDFNDWDYLEWLIGEVHRRGMEFHAWMNPYRIQNGVTTADVIANKYRDYPQNPASNPDMILVGTSGVILNPGEPQVREFIIDTAMEVIEKYDVDAIHFDDYFYIEMNQNTDAVTYNKYKGQSETNNVEDWRREQVNIFIKDLSDEMRTYNLVNNRQVQLGISPSGIWRNGNGVISGYNENGDAITTGSDTLGFSHYDGYLYSDTKKWIDEEWIDYIVPQSYWAFSRSVAQYAGIVDWWQQVVLHKNVNLYMGMGLYMIPGNDTEWNKDPYEAANQVLYSSQYENVRGISIYQYKSLASLESNPGVKRIKEQYWNRPTLNPEVRTMEAIIPGKVNDASIVKSDSGFILNWEPTTNARKYAVYRSTSAVDINDPEQLVGVVGLDKSLGMMNFEDNVDNTKNYNYAVVAVSGTNTLGEAYTLNTQNLDEELPIEFAIMNDIAYSGTLYPGENFRIFWKAATQFAGTEIEYEFQYSYNQVDWYEDVSGTLRKSGDTYSYFTTYPYLQQEIYYRVIGQNDLGSLQSNIIKLAPEVNGFGEYYNLVKLLIDNKLNNIFKENIK